MPDILSFLQTYGLPLTMLGLFAWAMIRRWFVTGAELTRMVELFERERADRIAAEANLAKLSGVNADVAEAVRDALSAVIKQDPYQERLAGQPRRGR